jgi:hypothetical protein
VDENYSKILNVGVVVAIDLRVLLTACFMEVLFLCVLVGLLQLV